MIDQCDDQAPFRLLAVGDGSVYGVGAEYIRKKSLDLALQGIVYPTAGASLLDDHALLPWFYECQDSGGLVLRGLRRCCRQRYHRAEGRLWAFAVCAFLGSWDRR